MTEVAVRRRDCKVCAGGPEVFEAVNEAVWDGRAPAEGNRTYGYRARAVRILGTHGIPGSVRVISRHAEHVENGHRNATHMAPQTNRESPLYPTDFVSVTDRMSHLGMRAADRIEREVDTMDAKDLVGVAALGLRAANDREKASRADRTPQLDIRVIFGVSGGFARDVGERVIEGEFSELDLKEKVARERAQLKALQAG